MEFSQEQLFDLLAAWGTSIILAVATLVAGLFVIGLAMRVLNKALDRGNIDP